MKNTKTKLLSLVAAATLGLAIALPTLVKAETFEGPSLFRDDFVTIHNVTKDEPQGNWADSINADPGNIVEIRILAWNQGQMTANHVQAIGHIDESLGLHHTFSGTLQAPYGGGTQITDTATVNITGSVPQTFRYEPGHARIFGVTNLYNCPSGCSLPDSIASTGLEIGDIQPGQSVQVAFKARMTNLVNPSPSATPAPTVNPTVAPSANPSATPGTINCNGSIIQIGAGQSANCNNNVNNNTQNQTVNVTTATVSPSSSPAAQVIAASTSNVKELPNTGLPIAGLALTGLAPLGLKLKKFGKGVQSLSPNNIWEMRAFNKEA